MQDRIFYSTCLGFVLGILLRSFVFVNIYFALCILALAFVVITFSYFTKLKWGILCAVFVLGFSLGVLRFHVADKPAPEVFESQMGQKVTLTGLIVDEPTERENNEALTVETEEQGAKAKILVTVNSGDEFKYGDGVTLMGTFSKPENFLTDQGKEFDYVNYLRKDGILYLMKYPKVQVLSSGNGNWVKSKLFALKENFLAKINTAIPSPESLLMGGLILGDKASFSQEERQDFIDTGTIHIVALSGYNVTIVAEWLMKLFSFLPRHLGIGIGIFAIWLFLIMTGFSSTAIRAGIMATLALVARATERDYDVARALALAAVVMLLINPLVLVYDVSFQLSFIATIAVIFLSPRMEKYFMWVPKKFQLRDIATVTSAAYVFVTPFILYEMGNLSLVALPANILILPFIPFTMMLGFITGLAGMIWYGLAVPFGYLSYFFLHYELNVINFFARMPFAAFSISSFPLVITLLIYAWFVYKLFGRNLKKFFTGPF